MARLTPRQRQILQMIANGMTQRQIARKLGIHPATVRNILKRNGSTYRSAMERLNVHTMPAAVAEAIRAGEIR